VPARGRNSSFARDLIRELLAGLANLAAKAVHGAQPAATLWRSAAD
jgi:hypothetical protein